MPVWPKLASDMVLQEMISIIICAKAEKADLPLDAYNFPPKNVGIAGPELISVELTWE